MVISANSDPLILTPEGLVDWMGSIQYGAEFLNQSLGARQAANLGDGNGSGEPRSGDARAVCAKLTSLPDAAVNQTNLLRYNYFDIYYGTLKESIEGGSHVRYWRQNGSVGASF